MILTRESLLSIYKRENEIYLSIVDRDKKLLPQKDRIEFEKRSYVKAEQDDCTPVVIDDKGKILYEFDVILSRGDRYTLEL